MPELVIFDFDGTLADTKHIAYHVYLALAEKHGISPMSAEALDRLGGLSIRRRLKEHGIPMWKLPGLVRSSVPLYRREMAGARLFEGIKPMLERLSGDDLVLAVVSSNNVENIERILASNEVDCFAHLVGKASLFGKHRKIRRLLKRLNVSPKDAIYVGDELRDVEAAKKARISSVAVTWGFDHTDLLEKAAPDHLAHSPETLVEVLCRWRTRNKPDNTA